MKLIPSFGEISSKTKDAFKRFPVTISWAILGTLFTIYTVESGDFDDIFYGKIILTFILGISWFIAARFFEEQFKTSKEWFMVIPFVFMLAFYFHLPSDKTRFNNEFIIRFILYFISGHLMVFVAPFILKWNKSAYFNYLKSVFVAIVRSLFFSLILYLGIVLALLAVKHLFNVDIKGERFFQIFIICLGIVNTWIYLSDFPKDIHSQIAIDYTKALEVLVKYILIPLVILYLIILYAYSLKIVINWNLPKGWVSYLVIALSFLGFIIQILINPIQKTSDSRPIKRFHPWFYYLLLPLIGLLFVAIFKRVNEYGITENRYFVLVLALWILAMTLYMLFSKHKRIRVFPLSLAAIALVVSLGFWGAFSVSTKSQVSRFEKVYNDIKNTDFTTTYQKKDQLRSIINYLNKKEAIDKVAPVLGYKPSTAFNTKSSWQLQSKLMDTLAIKVTDKPADKYRNYHYSINEFNMLIDIKGYDLLKNIYLGNSGNKKEKTIDKYRFSLQEESNIIAIWKEDELIGNINCSELINKLKQQDKNYNIDSSLMTLEKEIASLKVKMLFKSISMPNPNKEDKNYMVNANTYILIKENAE
ncbi:DUF4153 domain-containing protein [Tenacibaculum sp. S7007]|uniref:DUF4153 domain-containing protein n=1 Tax=Tenacibaculum pelagium TaxID=2759527 RepID=A0A839AQW3_9FLAO|nr:DUF4153 domain-containing protein [Tenacibaculum pelagium]MBA6156770.1 DUF4153 domain-containing protein [Tenacibaculum pelagium]